MSTPSDYAISNADASELMGTEALSTEMRMEIIALALKYRAAIR